VTHVNDFINSSNQRLYLMYYKYSILGSSLLITYYVVCNGARYFDAIWMMCYRIKALIFAVFELLLPRTPDSKLEEFSRKYNSHKFASDVGL
jgi:lipid-A-disaccharide synthase-like uncharacterized protein